MRFSIFCILLLFTTHLHFNESVPIRAKRDLKDDLIRRANRLLNIASGEIRLLKDEGKEIEANGLAAVEVRLVQFELLLKTATNEMEIVGLETALQTIEEQLQTLLTSAGKQHVSNQELAKLIQRAQDVNKKATEQVKRLKAQNNTLEASGIEREQIRLINLELDLRSAVKSEEIRRLAELLVELEQNFEELLADISVAAKRKKRQADPIRDQLIRRATDLIARANAEIDLLKVANRTSNISLLQTEVAAIQDLVTQLRAATAQADIRTLETNLNAAENRLEAELRRLDVDVVSAAEQNALIARAEALNVKAAAAITDLRTAGRTQLATQLQTEEAQIADLVRQLRAARAANLIRQLENRLVQAENKLEQELNAINVTVSDPEKDALVKRATEVVNKTTAEINKLKSESKTQEAATLESEVRLVTELVTELKTVNVSAEVARVTKNLKESLDRIEATIKQLEATATSDPERDALFKRAADLKAKANTLVYKLKSESKELEAELVWSEQTLVDEIVAELTNARDAAAIKQLKDKLKADLDKLEATLEKLDKPVNNEILRASLLQTAESLDTKAKEAITKSKLGKTNLAELERQEKAITELIASIKSANETAALRKLGENITNAETLLSKEIERLSKIVPVISDADIEALIKKVEDLAIKAKTAIRNLREQGKTLLADGLALEVEGLIVMDVILRSATPEEAARLVAEIEIIEKRVEQQLSQLSQTRRKRQAVLQATILKRAEDLLQKANAEITALRAENKTADITLLQTEEELIKELVNQLKSAGNKSVLDLILYEQKLLDAENKLDDELKRLKQETVNLVERDAIIKKAEDLNAKAAAEITKLRTEGRALLADQLQEEEEVIAELVRQLKAARQGSQIKQLEQKLNDTAKRLEDELSKITHVINDPEKDELLKRAEAVSANATTSLNKLKADNRSQEAATIESEQRLIAELVKELKKAVDPNEAKQAKDALKQNLDRLEQSLKSIVDIVPVDTEKEALLKRIDNLTNRTTTQIYRLKSEGKNAEAATFSAELELIDLLEDTLVNSKDAAEVKRVKDRLKEKLDKLESEVKALEDLVSDPDRDALVKRAELLKNRTTAQIEKLKGVGNVTEAEALQSELTVVNQLSDTAKNAKTAPEIKIAKESLKKALDTLEPLVKKIEDTPAIDKDKVALLKRADELKNRTTAEANRLKGNNQTAAATALETKLEVVNERLNQLEKATTAADNDRLKKAVKELLDNLEADVKKSEDTPLNDPEKDELLKRAENVTASATQSVATLKSQDRTQEAATIEAEVKLIKELVSELVKVSNVSESRRVKDGLKAALDQLENDLKAAAKPLIDDKEKETAVNKAQDLLKEANDAIAKLKAANRSAAATELEKQSPQLTQLANQLKNATKPDEFKSLQQKLTDSADALKKEQQRLDELDKAIKAVEASAEALRKQANDSITKLKTANRSALTTELEKQEQSLSQVPKQLQSAGKLDDVKQIEQKVNDAADVLKKEQQRLDDLVKAIDILANKTQTLQTKANDAIKKYTNVSDTTELEKQELLLGQQAKQVQNVTKIDDLNPIEQKVNASGDALNKEVLRLEQLVKDIDALAKKVADLVTKAKAGSAELTKQGKTLEAGSVDNEVQALDELSKNIKSAKTSAELTSFSDQFSQIEKRVTEQLTFKLRRKRDLKADLFVLLSDLLVRADAEIKLLQQQNRTEKANQLIEMETTIKQLEEKLKQATNQSEIDSLEINVTRAGGGLYNALSNLGIQLSAKELRLALIVSGEFLIVRANEEIKKLEEQNRTNSIALIKEEEKQIVDLVAQLRNATLEIDVEQLESKLLIAENRLQAELIRAGVGWDYREAKDIILQSAAELTKRINSVVDKLKQEGRIQRIELLEQEQKNLADLVAKLNNASIEDEIKDIELSLGYLELRVEIELANIGETVVTSQERQTLIREIEELAAKALIEGRKLNAQNRTLEAEGLFREQQALVELDVEARNAIKPQEFLSIEARFKQIETKVLNQIRLINQSVF